VGSGFFLRFAMKAAKPITSPVRTAKKEDWSSFFFLCPFLSFILALLTILCVG